jgi:hypothetical protein
MFNGKWASSPKMFCIEFLLTIMRILMKVRIPHPNNHSELNSEEKPTRIIFELGLAF